MDKVFLKKLGMQIKRVREQKGYSQERLRLEGDLSRSTIFRLEGGHVDPRASTLARIADILGVPVKKLFDF